MVSQTDVYPSLGVLSYAREINPVGQRNPAEKADIGTVFMGLVTVQHRMKSTYLVQHLAKN
jgi:hypothetical protein